MQPFEYQGPKGTVRWLHTTRDQGNLGLHVGDDPIVVNKNRAKLAQLMGTDIQWLNQVHGDVVLPAGELSDAPDADGLYIGPGIETAAAVMTADCLSVVIFSEQGNEAGVVHAGWRGLAAGIIARLLGQFEGRDLRASLGPTLCQKHFEVGPEVEEAFVALMGGSANYAFIDSPNAGKRLGDLHQLASMQLGAFGVEIIDESPLPCTYCTPQQYFSYRRDQQTGRQASIVSIRG